MRFRTSDAFRRKSILWRIPSVDDVIKFAKVSRTDMREVVQGIDDECRERWPSMLTRLVNLGDWEVERFSEEFGIEDEVFGRILQLRDELVRIWNRKLDFNEEPDLETLLSWAAMPELNPGRWRWGALESLIDVPPPLACHFPRELAQAVTASWHNFKQCPDQHLGTMADARAEKPLEEVKRILVQKYGVDEDRIDAPDCDWARLYYDLSKRPDNYYLSRKFVARRPGDKYCCMDGCREGDNEKSRRSYAKHGRRRLTA
jgi:hypothetical protein